VSRGADVFDVVVDGGDAAALLAARECARFGFRVAVIDDPARWMFTPEDFTAHGDAVADLCLELGVEVEEVNQAPEALNVAGIPVNPFSPSVRSSIGWSGAWRVYLDRLRPLLQIGNEVNFDKLVRRRLGARAFERVVLPELSRLFGITDAAVPVTALAPGLPEAMSRVGSLTGGALELIATDQKWASASESLVAQVFYSRLSTKPPTISPCSTSPRNAQRSSRLRYGCSTLRRPSRCRRGSSRLPGLASWLKRPEPFC
jgi:hypothetical protein